MSLDIAGALKEGFNRTVKKSGLMIIGLIFIASFLNTIFTSSLEVALGTESANTVTALALPLPAAVSGVLTFAGVILSTVVGIAAIRTFVSNETEHIPREFFKRNILMTFLNILAAGIVVGLLVMLPLFILVLPGAAIYVAGMVVPGAALAAIGGLIGLAITIYLGVSLIFTNVYVAAEDQNFIDGMKSSWESTKGHKLPLVGLGIIVFAITIAFNGILSIPTLAGLEVVGTVFSQLGGAAASAFTSAVLAQAYLQLTSKDEEEELLEDDEEESEDGE